MANVLKGRVWTLDTAGGGVIYSGWLKIALIYWKGPTTIGHTAVLNDINGRPILDAVAEVALQSQVFRVTPMWYQGLNLATLASGLIELHIE